MSKNPMDEKNNKVLKETEQQADKPINKADLFNELNGLKINKSEKELGKLRDTDAEKGVSVF